MSLALLERFAAAWNAHGNRYGVSAWTFRGTDRDGLRIEVQGVDLFEFRDGKIARKDTYRKQRNQA